MTPAREQFTLESDRVKLGLWRLVEIAKGSRELADMEVRIDKTETMFPRDDECGWEVTFNEYEEVEWNHTCEYCGRGF